MTWRPLYRGAEAEAIRQIVREVAAAIASGAGEQRRPADLALFWAYVAGELDDDDVQAEYDLAVARLIDWIASGSTTTHLHGGLAGGGWVLSHVSEPGAADPALEVIDEALLRAIEEGHAGGAFDLIGGIAGSAVYFLERLQASRAPLARRALTGIVRKLERTCTRTDEGVTWLTGPQLLSDWQRQRWPNGYHDCGVAHGVPGVLAVLAKIAAVPDLSSPARELYAAALAWLDARRGPATPSGRYPSMVEHATSAAASPSRAAWCYGDPGVIAARWSASSSLGLPTAADMHSALECIEHPAASSGVVDAGLCHGAIGLAHLFNRFYQASGVLRFADSARAWFERGLAMRRPHGLGGFESLVPQDDGALQWRPGSRSRCLPRSATTSRPGIACCCATCKAPRSVLVCGTVRPRSLGWITVSGLTHIDRVDHAGRRASCYKRSPDRREFDLGRGRQLVTWRIHALGSQMDIAPRTRHCQRARRRHGCTGTTGRS
jgi:hypothetical protein